MLSDLDLWTKIIGTAAAALTALFTGYGAYLLHLRWRSDAPVAKAVVNMPRLDDDLFPGVNLRLSLRPDHDARWMIVAVKVRRAERLLLCRATFKVDASGDPNPEPSGSWSRSVAFPEGVSEAGLFVKHSSSKPDISSKLFRIFSQVCLRSNPKVKRWLVNKVSIPD